MAYGGTLLTTGVTLAGMSFGTSAMQAITGRVGELSRKVIYEFQKTVIKYFSI